MIKNENMNKESINAMKEFQKKHVKSNIFLHKIFFAFLLCLNLVLLIFIIIYKSKISQIKLRNEANTNILSKNKIQFDSNENKIQKKLVNIFSNLHSYTYYFSYIFETSKEVNLMKNTIKDFYEEQNIKLKPEEFTIYCKFQGISDGDGSYILKEKINYSYNTFILIEAENNIKFGFFIQGAIIEESYHKYDDRENNCFLLFFKSEKMFKCKGDKTKLKIKNDKSGILIIGEDDISIKNHFLNEEKCGTINFPFKSFENGISNDIDLNGEFRINGIEIFNIDFHNN